MAVREDEPFATVKLLRRGGTFEEGFRYVIAAFMTSGCHVFHRWSVLHFQLSISVEQLTGPIWKLYYFERRIKTNDERLWETN